MTPVNWSRLEADLLLEFEEIIGLKQEFARFFSEELAGVWLVKWEGPLILNVPKMKNIVAPVKCSHKGADLFLILLL